MQTVEAANGKGGRVELPRIYLVLGALFVLLAIGVEVLLLATFSRLGAAARSYNAGTQIITLHADVQRETLKLKEAILVAGQLDDPEVEIHDGLLRNQLRVLSRAVEQIGSSSPETAEATAAFTALHERYLAIADAPAETTSFADALATLDELDRTIKRTSAGEEVAYVGMLRGLEGQTRSVQQALFATTLLLLALGIALGASISRRYRSAYAKAYVALLAEMHARRDREEQLRAQAEQLAKYAAEMEATNEALRVADATKNDFVSIVSHELRTPLTAIRGFSQTLLARGAQIAPDQQETIIRAIERQGARQQRLIDDLLMVSRMMSGTLNAQPESLLLLEAVTSACEAIVDIDIDVQVPADIRVECDPDHLAQVLTNLLTNAGKYGEGRITVTAAPDGHDVEIRVRDHGPGVPADFVDKLFDRFEQASTGDRRTSSGLGLGLAISRDLCELNRGQIGYEPQESGACFVVQLPQAAAASPEDHPRPLSAHRR